MEDIEKKIVDFTSTSGTKVCLALLWTHSKKKKCGCNAQFCTFIHNCIFHPIFLWSLHWCHTSTRVLSTGAGGKGHGCHHDRNCGVTAVLLCRGLPPAVPEEKTQRLLRPQRHRHFLPHRSGQKRGVRMTTEYGGWVNINSLVIEAFPETVNSALS